MQKPRSPGMPYDIPCVKLLKVKNKLTGYSMLAHDDFILKLCILTGFTLWLLFQIKLTVYYKSLVS